MPVLLVEARPSRAAKSVLVLSTAAAAVFADDGRERLSRPEAVELRLLLRIRVVGSIVAAGSTGLLCIASWSAAGGGVGLPA